MPQNDGFLQWATERVVRQLDAGEYSAKRKGMMIDVVVNAPGIQQADTGGREFTITESTDEKGNVTKAMTFAAIPAEEEYARTRRVVCVLYGWQLDQVERLDDGLLNWLYNEGMRLRREWLTEEKNA